jgi:sortase A
MSKRYYRYRKISKLPFRKWFQVLSLGILILGVVIVLYAFSPLILWQFYFSPTFASQNITPPIPKNQIVNQDSVQDTYYRNAKNWFPNFNPSPLGRPKVSSYTLSIPKIRINDALVSTMDTDLGKHLVNYQGTSVPGDFGNAVIFGHSTLPQLYNPKDYKTILANAYKLKIGDSIYSNVNGVTYQHNIYNITVVGPDDTSVFTQDYDNSYLTLVTCTPPGTVWKRLVIKARLSKV